VVDVDSDFDNGDVVIKNCDQFECENLVTSRQEDEEEGFSLTYNDVNNIELDMFRL
jgi:hypothetical protein